MALVSMNRVESRTATAAPITTSCRKVSPRKTPRRSRAAKRTRGAPSSVMSWSAVKVVMSYLPTLTTRAAVRTGAAAVLARENWSRTENR